jgi:hypothetical protein
LDNDATDRINHKHDARNRVEEGAKRLSPSSSEISLPAKVVSMRKRHANQHETSRTTMLKRT